MFVQVAQSTTLDAGRGLASSVVTQIGWVSEPMSYGRLSAAILAPMVVAAALLCAHVLAAPTALYHGNRSSRVFHGPSCKYYNCANCTVTFSSVTEATQAGYNPCGICKPAGTMRPLAQTGSGGYLGNTQSQVFHRLSCRYATCKNCTMSFKTREEAVASGYRPGGCCKP